MGLILHFPHEPDNSNKPLKEKSVILTTSFYDIYQKIFKKRLFPKFQLIATFRLQVMHDYVH